MYKVDVSPTLPTLLSRDMSHIPMPMNAVSLPAATIFLPTDARAIYLRLTSMPLTQRIISEMAYLSQPQRSIQWRLKPILPLCSAATTNQLSLVIFGGPATTNYLLRRNGPYAYFTMSIARQKRSFSER